MRERRGALAARRVPLCPYRRPAPALPPERGAVAALRELLLERAFPPTLLLARDELRRLLLLRGAVALPPPRDVPLSRLLLREGVRLAFVRGTLWVLGRWDTSVCVSRRGVRSSLRRSLGGVTLMLSRRWLPVGSNLPGSLPRLSRLGGTLPKW